MRAAKISDQIAAELSGAAHARVLVIDAPEQPDEWLPALLPEHGHGLVLVMESDSEQGMAMRSRLSTTAYKDRVNVIVGPPQRMLYKIAGPFDVIVWGIDRTPELSPAKITALLRAGGRLITIQNDAVVSTVKD